METKKSNKFKTFASLMNLYSPHKGTLVAIVLCSCLSALSDLVYPYITKYIINNLMGQELQEAIQKLIYAAIGLIVLFLIESLTKYVTNVSASCMTDKIATEIRERLFDHYQRMSFSYFDNTNVGGMLTTMDSDVDHVDKLIFDLPTYVVSIAISSIGAVIVFSNFNSTLMLILFPLIPCYFIFQILYNKKLREKFKRARETKRKIMEFTEDKLSGIRTIISFGNEDIENAKFRGINQKFLKVAREKYVGGYIYQMGSVVFDNSFYGLMIILGGYLAITGKMDITDMIIFYMYSYMITGPIKEFSGLSKEFQEAIVSYQTIMDCLNTDPEISNPKESMKPSGLGDITFNNVTFSYGKSNESVLENINLTIHEGEYIAIAGPSGSGKSTIAGLIPRYYDVSSGSICANGINIKDIELNHLRREIGVVQQDIYLFNGTVMDNIAYAKPNATIYEVRAAAKMANADEFISKLPNGYNSEIGERGVKLSGGQKQRIAIARLFLMNPSVLIFDEATSALDNESEKLVQEALEKLAENRTTIVIAHRLTTIQNADRILFLTEDGIEEEGTHKQLMEKNGKYAKLYNSHQSDDE